MKPLATVSPLFFLALTLSFGQQALASIQTVYSCSLEDGVTFEQLMKYEKGYVAELKKLDGGEKFTASISTPIAAEAEQGKDFVWVGISPDWTSYAKMTEAYMESKSAQKAAGKFTGIASCDSSSIWQSNTID